MAEAVPSANLLTSLWGWGWGAAFLLEPSPPALGLAPASEINVLNSEKIRVPLLCTMPSGHRSVYFLTLVTQCIRWRETAASSMPDVCVNFILFFTHEEAEVPKLRL